MQAACAQEAAFVKESKQGVMADTAATVAQCPPHCMCAETNKAKILAPHRFTSCTALKGPSFKYLHSPFAAYCIHNILREGTLAEGK
jgi:hypothetical protein